MKEYAAAVDSVSVCLSKGLGVPVGSSSPGARLRRPGAKDEEKMLGADAPGRGAGGGGLTRSTIT
jgi:threonine aldolase